MGCAPFEKEHLCWFGRVTEQFDHLELVVGDCSSLEPRLQSTAAVMMIYCRCCRMKEDSPRLRNGSDLLCKKIDVDIEKSRRR